MSLKQDEIDAQRDLIQAQKIQFVAMMDLNSSTKSVGVNLTDLQSGFQSLHNVIRDLAIQLNQYMMGLQNSIANIIPDTEDYWNTTMMVNKSAVDSMQNMFSTMQNYTESINNLTPTAPKQIPIFDSISKAFSLMKSDLTMFADGLKWFSKGMFQKLMTPGGSSEQSTRMVSAGFGSMIKHTFGTMGNQAKAALKPLGRAFGQMFPQMAALALVMEPVMAFIGGLLEPFSMITDMFAAFGEILGSALIPVLVENIMPLLIDLIPIFVSIAEVLAPVIQLLFSFTGIGILIKIFEALMPAIQPIVDVLLKLVEIAASFILAFTPILEIILVPLTFIANSLGDAFEYFMPYLEQAIDWIKGFADGIRDFIDTLKSFSWNDIGTAVTGGGADKYGWW